MSDDPLLGKLVTSNLAERDAIHVAILPVEAAHRMYPAVRVGLTAEGLASTDAPRLLGIVDQFLVHPVEIGERFYLVLFPQTVTGMRHHWRHPLVDQLAANTAQPDHRRVLALAKLEATANHLGVRFDELMDDMRDFVRSGDYRIDGGRWEGMSVGDEDWDAFEILEGVSVPEHDRGGVYSCSC